MNTGDRFIVITGGPGSGKTTLIEALSRAGLQTMPEAGRAIIQDQTRIGGRGEHRQDKALYAELMLQWELRSWNEAQALPGLVVFDRGVPDIIGYLALYTGHVPDHVRRAAGLYRYSPTVFIAPPWPAIFLRDAERGQTYQESVATAEAMVRAYSESGYRLVNLPLESVEARVDFVLSRLGWTTPRNSAP